MTRQREKIAIKITEADETVATGKGKTEVRITGAVNAEVVKTEEAKTAALTIVVVNAEAVTTGTGIIAAGITGGNNSAEDSRTEGSATKVRDQREVIIQIPITNRREKIRKGIINNQN